LVYGNPARQRGWACECGIVLALDDRRGTCADCGRGYRLLAADMLVQVSPGEGQQAA